MLHPEIMVEQVLTAIPETPNQRQILEAIHQSQVQMEIAIKVLKNQVHQVIPITGYNNIRLCIMQKKDTMNNM